MLSHREITDVFYLCDEFSLELNKELPNYLLKEDDGKKHRNKPNRLSDSEVLTILIAFLLSQVRNLKAFYLGYRYSIRTAQSCIDRILYTLSWDRLTNDYQDGR